MGETPDIQQETTFEKTMRTLVQRADQIDILVETKKNSANGAVTNNVAMVVPATTLIPTNQGALEIVFRAPPTTDVVAWFPEPWFSKYADGTAADNPMTIKAGQKVTVVVDTKLTGGNKIRPYKVWAKNINEFAVGDSPPKMVLDP